MSGGHSRPGYSAPNRRRGGEQNVRGTFAPWLFGAGQAPQKSTESPGSRWICCPRRLRDLRHPRLTGSVAGVRGEGLVVERA